MTSLSSYRAKNSLTFENVVCSQLELQRRAASFSHRRNTVCRRSSSTRQTLSIPVSSQSSSLYPSTKTLSSLPSDITTTPQFFKTRYSTISKHSRTSSLNSNNNRTRIGSVIGRQSFLSMSYSDTSSRNLTMKKDERRWSVDYPKSNPFYWSLRSRLIEEYTESESLLEFAKKTLLILMKTKEATILLCFLLILPILMMTTGVSHLSDCPCQVNLPIYLFVGGTVWTTKLLQNLWQKYRLRQKRFLEEEEEESSSDRNDGQTFIDISMSLFLFIWFLFGQYWLITIGYPPQYEQTLNNPEIWCEKSVVFCAFISILFTYLLFLFSLILLLFLIYFTRYTIQQQQQQQQTQIQSYT